MVIRQPPLDSTTDLQIVQIDARRVVGPRLVAGRMFEPRTVRKAGLLPETCEQKFYTYVQYVRWWGGAARVHLDGNRRFQKQNEKRFKLRPD